MIDARNEMIDARNDTRVSRALRCLPALRLTPATLLASLRAEKSRVLTALLASLLAALLVASSSLALTACAPSSSNNTRLTVRVASLRGPTSIGLVKFIDEARNETRNNATGNTTGDTTGDTTGNGNVGENLGAYSDSQYNYQFEIFGAADEIVYRFINGSLDIAVLPANIAAVLYHRTKKDVSVINVNNLGVLYVVSADESISTLEDLRGRTVLMTGKATTPEYVMNTLLYTLGITDVRLEYKTEATELAAAVSADPRAIAVLPEPYVTSVLTKNPELNVCFSLSDVWAEVAADSSNFVTSVTIVRTSFAQKHPEAVAEFLARQKASVAFINENAANAAQLVVGLRIIDDVAIAEAAIPRCNLVCITGLEMRAALDGYITALFKQDPASVGGSLPGDDFYYMIL